MKPRPGICLVTLLALTFAACKPSPPQIVGTLEWDRITLPAPVSERIATVSVREGDSVVAGHRASGVGLVPSI